MLLTFFFLLVYIFSNERTNIGTNISPDREDDAGGIESSFSELLLVGVSINDMRDAPFVCGEIARRLRFLTKFPDEKAVWPASVVDFV